MHEVMTNLDFCYPPAVGGGGGGPIPGGAGGPGGGGGGGGGGPEGAMELNLADAAAKVLALESPTLASSGSEPVLTACSSFSRSFRSRSIWGKWEG